MSTTADPPAGSEPPARPWLWELGAALIALGAVGLRCIQWRSIFGPDGVVLPGVDPYYHLWRARMLVDAFPAWPTWDPHISFPNGGSIPWPPGFDLLVAAPGLLGLGPDSLATWGALLSPLLGGLAVYLTWRLGKAAFDRPTGLVAAGLLACSAGAFHFAKLGRIDHHALVAPLSLAMGLAFVRALGCTPGWPRRGWAGVAAGFSAAAVAAWIITPPLYFLPALGVVLLACRGDQAAARSVVLWGVAGTAALVAGVVFWTGDLGADAFSLYRPSLLHLGAYLGAAALAIGLAWRLRPRVWIGAGLGGLGLIGLGLGLGAWAPVAEALGVALGQDPSYLLALESRSVLFPRGEFSPLRVVRLYTALSLVWPLLVAGLWWRLDREGPAGHARRLVALWAALGLCLVFAQERFGEYAAPALMLVTAWFLVSGGRWVVRRLRSPGIGLARRLLAGGIGLLVLGALWPLTSSVAYLADEDPVVYQRELLRFGRDLAIHTPEARGPDGRSDWGLLTGWMDAHPLLATTGLPVATSSFGTRQALEGNRRAFGLLLEADEDALAAGMAAARLRYLVVSNQIDQLQAMAATAGHSEPFVDERFGRHGGESFRMLVPRPAYFATVAARLWLADGARRWPDGQERPGLGRFRLVVESAAAQEVLGMQPAMFKAFEPVTGAELAGQAEPGEAIRLRLAVRTNTGRRFTYERRTVADRAGGFVIRVPYATKGSPGPCRPEGPYRLRLGDRVVHLQVDEAAILSGARIPIPAPTDP